MINAKVLPTNNVVDLAENNKKELEHIVNNCPEQKVMKENFKKTFGFSMDDKEKFPVSERGFSFEKAKNKLRESIREADSTSSFSQLLIAGIQTVTNQMYLTASVTYDQWTTTVMSKKHEEPYAPIQGITFPGEVPEQGIYPEAHMAGQYQKIVNKKFGSVLPYAYELSEDDQTGQVLQQGALMGEYMRQVLEVICYGKLASVVGGSTYGALHVSASETSPSDETNWPWMTAAVGRGTTRPNTYLALTKPNIQTGFTALRDQLNILGLKMAVNPNTVIIGTYFEFDLLTILNSTLYPSVPTTNPGDTGFTMANNVLQGAFKPVISRFMPTSTGAFTGGTSKRWVIADVSKPAFVVQIREPISIIMEAPNSGESFNRDVLRTKSRARQNADFIEPRFFWQGNDGSI